MPQPDLRIALLTEGTYPYGDGGVSTWCDKLISNLSECSFTIYAVTSQPIQSPRFEPLPNVASVVQIPLWGVEQAAEWLGSDKLVSLVRARRRTTDAEINRVFAPALRRFLAGFNRHASLGPAMEGLDAMSRFLREHDYERTVKSAAIWREVLKSLGGEWARSALRGAPATAEDAQICARWLYAFFMPLVAPPPSADLVHATAAAFSAIVGLLAKAQHGTPLVVTEHGVYLRERYIAVADSDMPQLQKAFLVALSSLVSRLCYAQADLIVPVCDFNQRWEIPHGDVRDRLLTIHNSVDVETFVPAEKPAERRDRPTVVVAARVFPLKDIETMVRAAAMVRRGIPDVHFILFGSLTANPKYTARVRSLISELGLEATFELAGVHPRPAEIYNQGDISALSSISEAFPYTVLESMACGRPVVATDVGGVSEVVGDLGKLVAPRSPEALARACVELLSDDALRLTLGRRAREHIVTHFRDEKIYDEYRRLYRRLTTSHEDHRQTDHYLPAG